MIPTCVAMHEGGAALRVAGATRAARDGTTRKTDSSQPIARSVDAHGPSCVERGAVPAGEARRGHAPALVLASAAEPAELTQRTAEPESFPESDPARRDATTDRTTRGPRDPTGGRCPAPAWLLARPRAARFLGLASLRVVAADSRISPPCVVCRAGEIRVSIFVISSHKTANKSRRRSVCLPPPPPPPRGTPPRPRPGGPCHVLTCGVTGRAGVGVGRPDRRRPAAFFSFTFRV